MRKQKTKTSIFCQTIVLFLICISCNQKIIPDDEAKTEAEIELLRTKTILEEIGETTLSDTDQYRRFVYFCNEYLSNYHLLSVKDLKEDTLAIFTLANFHGTSLPYISSDDTDQDGLKKSYRYIRSLKKLTSKLNSNNANQILNYFDSLVTKHELILLGNEAKIDRSGDIVDGGYWIFYFDGRNYYKYNNISNSRKISEQSIHRLFEHNIDFKPIVQELSHAY